MIKARKTLLVLSLFLLMPAVQAQIYMCKDVAGKTITSDRPIPTCEGAVREFANSGQLRRTIPAPLTAEQKEQKKREEEQRKEAEAVLAEQKRQDRAMLARYNNQSEINAARARAVEEITDLIKREKASIAESEKDLAKTRAEIAEYSKDKRLKPSPVMQHKVTLAESSIVESKKMIQEHEANIAQINHKFDETLNRFNEITASASAK